MRQVVWLAVLAMACERAKPVPVEPTESVVAKDGVKPTKSVVTKPDPWAVDDESTVPLDVPKWAHDPPNVLRDKINAVNAHVIVLKSVVEFAEYRDVLAVVEKTPGIVAAEPFIFVELYIASAAHGPVSLALKAVDPARVARVLPIGPRMKSGTLESLATGDPPSIILGDDLARTLRVGVGDRVTLTSPAGATNAWPPKLFRVSGTFHFDFDEYDERLAIAPLAAVQAMLGRGDHVLGIEATVKDLDRSADIAAAIQAKLGGPPYAVQDWYELNTSLFTALYGTRRP